MKHSLLKKLIIYFFTVLLLFAIITVGVFIVLFSRNTARIYQDELEKRAVTISQTLSEFMSGEITMGNGMMHGGGFGAYLRFIDDIAMSEIWIVNQNAETVEVAMGQYNIEYSKLPEEVTELIEKVFLGEHAFRNSVDKQSNVPKVMVGVPIYDSNQQVSAALILRNNTGGANTISKSAIQILFICASVAAAFVIILAYFLARSFISPLTIIEKTTKRIADGYYKVQTNINQQDEIGSLAKHIDILAHALDQASMETIKLEQMRKDFISNVSHELRTPITVIKSSLEALCDNIVTEPNQVSEYHQQMMLESMHLERMVHDLLELSRLQNPDYVIEKEHLNLVFVLDDAVRAIKRLTDKNEIKLHYKKEMTEFSFQGDYVRLRQMFMIVLDNAVKFSQNSTQPDIAVSLHNNQNAAIIRIINNGTKIKQEDLPYIFDKFYMAHSKWNVKGSGLGLSITKQIADRHDIKINVTSDTTTCFEFRFFNHPNQPEYLQK
jgi:signal transduction histidine kinase